MTIQLQSPGYQRRTRPLSVAAWHAMVRENLAPPRSELIRGAIIEKMSKSILHTRLASRLFRLFEHALSGSHWCRKEDPLTFVDSEPEPDISIVPGMDDDYPAHPSTADLVIEVAVSTLADDRELATLYAEAGVKEYWIINASARCIEVFREPAGGKYALLLTAAEGDSIVCSTLPVSVDLTALFAGLDTGKI